MADNRLRLPASQYERFAYLLAIALKGRGVGGLDAAVAAMGDVKPGPVDLAFVGAAADDLVKNRGAGGVIPGSSLSPRAHALVHAINYALGNVGKAAGKPVRIATPIDATDAPSREGIAELAAEVPNVNTLVMLGGNPVFDAPADVDFAELLARKGLVSVHLSSHRNET